MCSSFKAEIFWRCVLGETLVASGLLTLHHPQHDYPNVLKIIIAKPSTAEY
jgi:hypothetical protein